MRQFDEGVPTAAPKKNMITPVILRTVGTTSWHDIVSLRHILFFNSIFSNDLAATSGINVVRLFIAHLN